MMTDAGDTTLVQELIATEHARRAATMRGDLAAIESFMADTFHYAHISGLVESRQQYLSRTREHPNAIRFTSSSDLKVELHTGYALLTGKSRIESVNVSFESWFLSVWERGEAGWKIRAYA